MRNATPLVAALLVACAAEATPAREPTTPPPAVAASTREEPTVPTASAAPSLPAAETKPAPPPCMPRELREAGRIFAARVDAAENFSFCVKKGVGTEAPTRCLELSFKDKKLKGVADVWPGTSFFTIIEADTAPVASAEIAQNAGTLDVCLDRECVPLRLHAPMRGAFDEVFSVLPALAIPSSTRVLVARTEKNSELWLDAVDIKKKAKVATRRIASDEQAIELVPLGKKALLKSCRRESAGCVARVVDPQSLSATKLKIELSHDEPRGADAGSLVQRAASGEVLLVDRGGASAIWLDANGAVTRQVEIGKPAKDSESARVGRRNAREVIVIRAAPNAGDVALIGLEDGSVTRFDTPVCAQ